MLDIGWTELLVIGIVALIVVGPRDLPMMFRKLGQFTAKARGMAREFQRAMETAADEAGVKDIQRDLRDVASGKSLRKDLGIDDIEKSIGAGLEDIDKPRTGATAAKTSTQAAKAGAGKGDGVKATGASTASAKSSTQSAKTAPVPQDAKSGAAKTAGTAAKAAKSGTAAKAAKSGTAAKATKSGTAAKAANPDPTAKPAARPRGPETAALAERRRETASRRRTAAARSSVPGETPPSDKAGGGDEPA